MTNDFGKSTTTVTRQKRRLTICIPRVWSHRLRGERWRTEKKKSVGRGIGFFPTRGSVWSGRSMVGGVIKDLELPPYKLEKEQKYEERRKRIQRIRCSYSLTLVFSQQEDNGREDQKRKGERRRRRSSRGMRRQPVTNLTLNQLTCAWLHGAQTRADAYEHSRARSLDPGYSLVICITLCMRYSFLSNILAGGTCIRGPAK